MTFHYLDLLLDRRFIHILNTFSISHYLIFRPNFDELSFDENSTNGRVRRDVGFDGRSHSTKGLSTKCHGRELYFIEALPGVLGNRGKRAFISGEQRPDFEGNRGTKTILENREHKNFFFQFLGKKPTYFRGTREPTRRASLVR